MIQNLYKPKGITSFQLVGRAKRHFNVKKAGHAGTLDPLAEGVLVVLTGDDTKKQDEIMHQEKEYLAEITFGIVTDTLDMENQPQLIKVPDLKDIQVRLPQILQKYIGEFEQQIPNYSAKKINGKPMYLAMRKDPAILANTKVFKSVKVHELKIMTWGVNEITTNTQEKLELPFVELKIRCSHGFYVRALANDLGKDLETGAVLTKLVRTKVGNFSIENSIKIEETK